ncbi:MAG: hydrogenase formation protein HypD [Spirochaetes bacterium]|nr:hydrogenase formation protein HypD [Spirochaetota bacterium]
MNFIDEFRNKSLITNILDNIQAISTKAVTFMEVCGGHTHAILKNGIRELLPSNIELLSGPGCPVCVTARDFIDKAIALSREPGIIITTFGDMLRVPGSHSTLAKEKALGQDIRMVYSSQEALTIAATESDKKVIFLGIGFETTAPTSAAAILSAEKQNINNFFLLSSHKIMPPAMAALIEDNIPINGYICPGHVTSITGTDIYLPIVEKYQVGCVVSGFEPLDILQTIYMLTKQQENQQVLLENQYRRVVKKAGNLKAKSLMETVFEKCSANWRGLGELPASGLKIREQFSQFDAEKNFTLNVPPPLEEKGCICGLILKGLKKPSECPLFKSQCTPANPVGACMVSHEGACAAYYQYR